MAFVQRRLLSTLIPPKIASPANVHASPNAARMQKVVSFYERLPRGNAPATRPRNPFEWYQDKYFGDNPSAAPIWQLIAALSLFGYANAYYFHLRHHKNNAH